MNLAEFKPLVLCANVGLACRQAFVETCYSGLNAKKMGVKTPALVLTFLPLLVLALKRAPGTKGSQSSRKEVYS